MSERHATIWWWKGFSYFSIFSRLGNTMKWKKCLIIVLELNTTSECLDSQNAQLLCAVYKLFIHQRRHPLCNFLFLLASNRSYYNKRQTPRGRRVQKWKGILVFDWTSHLDISLTKIEIDCPTPTISRNCILQKSLDNASQNYATNLKSIAINLRLLNYSLHVVSIIFDIMLSSH